MTARLMNCYPSIFFIILLRLLKCNYRIFYCSPDYTYFPLINIIKFICLFDSAPKNVFYFMVVLLHYDYTIEIILNNLVF